MQQLNLDFTGPFSFLDRQDCVFRAPCAASAGVYLWTIRQVADDTHLIHYVGQTTKGFGQRQREHLLHVLGLNYGIWDPDKAQHGVSELVWPGLWRDRSPDAAARLVAQYASIADVVVRYLSVISIFFAPLDAENRLMRHVEGCIAYHLRDEHPEDAVLYPSDNRVGTMGDKTRGELAITAPEAIRGLDGRIRY